MKSISTRVVVEVSLTIALSAVLGTITLWKMPQGGSVSLVMLPLFVLALRRGPFVGLLAGALYGVVDSFIDPWVVHWAQYALDYPLAYAAIGLAGVFQPALRRSLDEHRSGLSLIGAILPAFIVGSLGRFVMHVVSGVIFFKEYAGDQNAVIYSAVYNSFVIVAAVACLAAAVLILPALDRAGVGETRE